MKSILAKVSNWRFILPLLVLTLIFPVFLFPNFQDRMTKSAGEEIIPLDSRFSYSYDEVMNAFDKLGAEGRSAYRFVIARIDNFFALFYGPLFILILAWLLKRLAGKDSSWVFLALFPVIGILFEYMENFNTLALLDSYPAISEEGVSWGSQMTGLKQIFLMASVLLMPALGLMLLVKNFKRRKNLTITDNSNL